MAPVKCDAGIGFSPGGYIRVAYDALSVDTRISVNQGYHNRGQHFILNLLVGHIIGAFEFDANGEVVTLFPTAEA